MRIACYHNLPSGGAKRVVREHCRGLRAAGHEVVVYELETADHDFCDVSDVADRVLRVPYTWHEPLRRGPKGRWLIPLRNLALLYRGHCRLAQIGARVAEEMGAGGFDLAYVHHDMFETAPSLLRYASIPTVLRRSASRQAT